MKTLKVKFLLVIASIFLSLPALAQLQLGAKIGAGLSNYKNINPDSQSRIAIQGGFLAKYQLEMGYYRNFRNYIQAELLYSTIGEENGPYKVNVNYLTIPVMYQHYLSDTDNDFFIEFGPQVQFVINDVVDQYPSPNPNMPWLGSDNNVLNKFDIAINGGVGYSYQRRLELNLRYSWGLVDSWDFKYRDNDFNRTSLISLSLTYLLDFNPRYY
ncbi:porin family protein [Faecalibacter bovis]|uniref:PorT family protein n=1 Tax=Faecalibacter bovis TaxID=2898187 RepID=A0ABX7XAL6_9FLAO|nr:porin family protein [Faecalibacter bovis]QTV04936.1 PorT family protein [Faecalibacter bovis]